MGKKTQEFIRFLKSFAYSQGNPQPAYFWISVFCLLAAVMVILRLCGALFSDFLITTVLSFVLGWIAVFNWDRKNKCNIISPRSSKETSSEDESVKGA